MTIKIPESIGVTPAGGVNVYAQATQTSGINAGVTPAGGLHQYADDTGWYPYPPKTFTAGFLNLSGEPTQNVLTQTSVQDTSVITARYYDYPDYIGARNLDTVPEMIRSDANRSVVYDSQSMRTGFENEYNDSTITFTNATRVFQIAPTVYVTTFSIWVKGKNYQKGTSTLTISNVEGSHYIYFDNVTLNLTEAVNPSATAIRTLIEAQVIVSYIYWDATNAKALFLNQEQHGISSMNGEMHAYLHQVLHTQWVDGLGLTSIVADGSGGSNASAQFGVAAGDIEDEDLDFALAGVASTTGLPVAWLSGAGAALRISTQAGYSVLNTGSGRLSYNNINAGGAGVWGQSEVSASNFVLYHIFATTSSINPIVSVMGQAQYTTVSNARAGASTELSTLIAAFPEAEFKPLGTIIFETSNGFSNAVKARVRSTDLGATYVDWRMIFTGSGVPTPATGLTGNALTLNHLSKYIGSNQEGDSVVTDDGTIVTIVDSDTKITNTDSVTHPRALFIDSGRASDEGNWGLDANNQEFRALVATTNNVTRTPWLEATRGTGVSVTSLKLTMGANAGAMMQRVLLDDTSILISNNQDTGKVQITSSAVQSGQTHGAFLDLYGNANAGQGAARLSSGNYSTALLSLATNGVDRLTIDTGGSIKMAVLAPTAGVVHNDSSGGIGSSLIINADVSNSAAIAYSKLSLSPLNINASGIYIGANIAAAGTPVYVTVTQDSATRIWCRNDNNTAASSAGFAAVYGNGTQYLLLDTLSPSYTTSGLLVASAGVVRSLGNTNGLRIFTQDNYPVTIGVNNTAVMTFNQYGMYIGSNAATADVQTYVTAPTGHYATIVARATDSGYEAYFQAANDAGKYIAMEALGSAQAGSLITNIPYAGFAHVSTNAVSGLLITSKATAKPIVVTSDGATLYFHQNEINGQYDINGVGSLALNYSGFQNGATQYRNTNIYDGKHNLVMQVTGSSRNVTIYQPASGVAALTVNRIVECASIKAGSDGGNTAMVIDSVGDAVYLNNYVTDSVNLAGGGGNVFVAAGGGKTKVGASTAAAEALDVAGAVKTTGDIYTVANTDYGASSSVTGIFSPVKHIWYTKVGKMVYVRLHISGGVMSTITATLPYAIANYADFGAMGQLLADGATSSVLYVYASAASTLSMYVNGATGLTSNAVWVTFEYST